MKEVLLSRAINRRNPDDFLSTQKPEITDSRSYALILRIGVNRMTKIQSLTGCLDSEEQTNTYYSNTENMSIYYQELRDCLSFFSVAVKLYRSFLRRLFRIQYGRNAFTSPFLGAIKLDDEKFGWISFQSPLFPQHIINSSCNNFHRSILRLF